MDILHRFHRHPLRLTVLAAALTVVVMALLLMVPLDGSGFGDPPPATSPETTSTVPSAPVVQTTPDWVARPLAPVSVTP